MKDKLNQFILNTQGQFIEVSDRTNEYQCMDLAELWVFILGFPKTTIQHLYAYEVFTKPTALTLQYFDLFPNTPTFIPEDGDLTVFQGGVAGHIGVALGGGTVASWRNFEQNYPIGTNSSIRLRNYGTPKLLGVLRPKASLLNPVTPITDQTNIPQIDNMEVQAIRSQLNDLKSNFENAKNKLSQIHFISG